MGASRESFKISNHWNRGGYSEKITFSNRVSSVLRLFKRAITNKWDRKLFFKDNVSVPYFKLIGCKLTSHKFIHDTEDQIHWCTRCFFKIDEKGHDNLVRKNKIKSIL